MNSRLGFSRLECSIVHSLRSPVTITTRNVTKTSRNPYISNPICRQQSSPKSFATLQNQPRTKSLMNIFKRQQRNIQNIPRTGSIRQNLKILFWHYPFSVTLAFSMMGACVAYLIWFNYYELYHMQPILHPYPQSVVKQLRRAWHYMNRDFQPVIAAQYLEKALVACREEGMDPLSDEVIGIRLQAVSITEKMSDIPRTIKTLESIRNLVLSESERASSHTELSPEEQQQRRTRLLLKTVQISLRLGDLYSNPFINNDTEAMNLLLWSVNTVLQENAARKANNANDTTHGKWLSKDEFGATLEALGMQYEKVNNHYLAAPLFLQALALKENKTDCHTVTLMNNLSISLAQQNIPAHEKGIGGTGSREAMVESGREWAKRALEVVEKIPNVERDEECDVACVVTKYNLGEFCEMLSDRQGAMERYQEAKDLAKKVGYKDGVEHAVNAIKRLSSR